METNHRRLALALLLSSLAACGGGGGGGHTSSIAAPSNLTYSDADAYELSGVEITPLLPTFDGEVDSFEVAPGLPPGLVLDPLTGVVAGEPLAPAARAAYTITARNAGGSTSAQVRLEIAAPQRFAFVASAADDSLATLTVDTGAARLLRGPLAFQSAADEGSERPVAHPTGPFVYVPHAASNTLAAWHVDTETGVLDRILSVPLGAGPHAAAIHPSGAWLLVTSQLDDEVRVFALNPASGLPLLTATVPLGTQPADLEFSPDGTQLFVVHAGIVMNGLGSSLAAYAFDAQSGALTLQGAPLALNGGRPMRVAVDPHEPLVYLTLSMFDAVLAVRTSATGALTPVPPLRPAGDDPSDLEVDARGRYLWVAAAADGQVRAFAIDPATGDLDATGSFDAGTDPRALHADASGGILHVVASGSAELITFRVGSAGALVREGSLALRSGSSALAFVSGNAPLKWTPRFVHVANAGSDDVHSFRVDAATGALQFTGQAFTDDMPAGLALDPLGARAYVVTEGGHSVQGFDVSKTDGTLTPVAPALGLAGTPMHVAVEPSGRFAYVAARDVVAPGDGWILTFAIDAISGALTQVDALAAGAGSCAVEVEPTAEYLYVANRGNGTPGTASITSYRIDPATGVPAAVGAPVVAPGIVGLAFHPDGRSAYAVLRGSDALARYAIDRASGSLLAVPPTAGPGLEPAAMVLDPRGRFAWASYTGNASAGEIDVLPLLEDGGLGPVIQQVVDGNYPLSLSLDRSGRFLYASNRDSHDISVLAVDAATGLLAARAPVLAGTSPIAVVATSYTH